MTLLAATMQKMAQRYTWARRSACKGMPPELFFPTTKGDSCETGKLVCATCDVRGDCLRTALVEREREGVWGGLTARERKRIPKDEHHLLPQELQLRYPVRLRGRAVD